MNSQKRWRIRIARGPVMTDPARAVAHVAQLQQRGATQAAIARAAGLSRNGLRWIVDGHSSQVHVDVEQRILGITYRSAVSAGRTFVPATGTARRVRALMTLGWPRHEISARSGVAMNRIQAVRTVSSDVEERIRILYGELCMTPGPSQRTAAYAQRQGWSPPLAWDDDTIDDPDAQPNIGEQVPVKDPRQSEHTAAEAQFLLSCGVSLDQAARQLGVTRKYLTDTLPGRLGRREAS